MLRFALVLILAGPASAALGSGKPIPYNGFNARGPAAVAASSAGSQASPAQPPNAQPRSARAGDLLVVGPASGASPRARQELEAAGFEIEAVLAPGGYIVAVREPGAASAWLNSDNGRASLAEPVRPEWKIDPAFRGASVEGRESEIVSVVASASDLTPELRRAVELAGGTVTSESFTPGKPRLGIQVEAGLLPALLDSLAQRPEVWSLDPGGGAKLLNDGAAPVMQSGSGGGGRPIWDRGIRGEKQVVAVLDTGIDFDSCYFREGDGSAPPVVEGMGVGSPNMLRRKVVMVDLLLGTDSASSSTDYDTNGHGTAVGGNALGSDIADPFGTAVLNGMAPAAKLIAQDGGFATDNCADLPALQCPVVDLTPILAQAVMQGANIHNNSWGDRENFSPQNTYTAPTADMDEAMWMRPDFLIVCAAGNGGPGPETVGSPSVAKNVISVAATSNPITGGDPENLTSFSSRGFAADGRIKPDIAAPGTGFAQRNDGDTTTDNCDTRTFSGTSMASPILAGCAALVRQYYVDGWHPSGQANATHAFIPTGALVKATILNGAADMAGVPEFVPNRGEGWGRAHLENSLYFEGDARKVLAVDRSAFFGSSADEPFEMYFRADGNAAAGRLKVTLVWTDFAGSPAASQALVNDLNLEVTRMATGETWLGNSFDPGSGLSVAGASLPDQINTVEMVILAADSAGEYRVRILPSNIVEAGQGFALVIGGDATALAGPNAAKGWKGYR